MRSKTLCTLTLLASLAFGAVLVGSGGDGLGTSGEAAGAAVGRDPWAGPLVPESGVLFGSWIRRDYSSQDTIKNAITSREADLGRKLAIDQHFYPFFKEFPSWREPWDIKSGRIPLIAWNGTNTWEVVRGDHDALIRDRAQAVRALGAPVFIRYMWEPLAKLDKIGSPQEYIAAWHHIRAIFDEEGATNVTWAWCGTAWGMRPGGPEFAYYPGDDVADWVCTDGYNWAPGRPQDKWRDWSWIMEGTEQFAEAHNKPVLIAEFGVQERNPGEKAAWMADAQAVIKTKFPNIKAIVYFDENRLFDWRVDTTASSYAAFKTWANDPFYRPTLGTPPATTTTTTAPPTTTTTTAPATTTTTAPATTTTTVPASTQMLFAYNFENATIDSWAHSPTAVPTSAQAGSGSWSLLTLTSSGHAWARHAFDPATAASASVRVKVASADPSATTPLVTLRNPSGGTVARVIRDANGRLGLLNGQTGTRTWSTTVLPLDTWSQVTLEVALSGSTSTAQVLVDGTAVPGLRLTADLGASRVSAIELGDVGGTDKTYAMFFDDVQVIAGA